MAFTNMILTAKGKVLYAKAQLGKSLHFTRVAIGDGVLGSEPMTSRTALVHEVHSMRIDGAQLVNNETVTSIIATMDNRDITVGYYYRELGIFAKDPDTNQEVLCLYDNAGADAEYIPVAGVKPVYERLRFLLAINATGDVTFEWSGNPLYPTYDEFEEALKNIDISIPIKTHNADPAAHEARFANKADLDPVTHQIVEAQIPGGLADEAVKAHNESEDPHANMGFFRAVDEGMDAALPVDADTLEGKTKAEVSAEILAAMDASLAPEKVRWDAKADLVAPVTVTVPLEGWTGAGPWVQTVAVAGVTAADNGLGVYPVDVADDAARKLYEKAYGCLAAEAETVAGGVVLTCRSGKPEVAFQVVVKGVR